MSKLIEWKGKKFWNLSLLTFYISCIKRVALLKLPTHGLLCFNLDHYKLILCLQSTVYHGTSMPDQQSHCALVLLQQIDGWMYYFPVLALEGNKDWPLGQFQQSPQTFPGKGGKIV